VNKIAYTAVAFLAAAVFGAFLLMTGPYDPFDSGDRLRARIARGHALYATRCASCHGKNLEGQPNWQTPLADGKLPAPPHDASGHSWHHADDVLIGITKLGLKPFVGDNYESNMPAFDAILTDAEITAIWTYIKSSWPERERAYQERITKQSTAATQNAGGR
jgi:mono/diheme cytochrome c family protein